MAFYWGNPLNWIRARRHLLAYVVDTTDSKRAEWVATQAARFVGSEEFRLDVPELPEEFSFIVLGDTGEGDSSQMVVADRFLDEAADTAFSIIAGDVVYPSGRSADYRQKFYIPFRDYGRDIYAVPGNHDWYDELVGFMIHFCGNTHHRKHQERETIDETKLDDLRKIRRNRVVQPNMYFYIDTPHVRVVCLDTGIRGRIDTEQEKWLARVSATPQPKILVLGKPIYVNGEHNDRLDNVNDILNKANYRLVIAGDTHNFQKYRVKVKTNGHDRFVWHLVNGGGGAYLVRTHTIPSANEMKLLGQAWSEPDDFECYPTRDQSRKFYSWWKENAPDWAVDRDRPPYHKSFVKVSVSASGLRVRVVEIDDFSKKATSDLKQPEWTIPF